MVSPGTLPFPLDVTVSWWMLKLKGLNQFLSNGSIIDPSTVNLHLPAWTDCLCRNMWRSLCPPPFLWFIYSCVDLTCILLHCSHDKVESSVNLMKWQHFTKPWGRKVDSRSCLCNHRVSQRKHKQMSCCCYICHCGPLWQRFYLN